MILAGIHFPKISSDWPKDSFAGFEKNAEVMNKLATTAGKGSTAIQEAQIKVRQLIREGRFEVLSEAVRDRRRLLALCVCLANEPQAFQRLRFTEKLAESFADKEVIVSTQALRHLLRCYFNFFVKVHSRKDGILFIACLDAAVQKVKERRQSSSNFTNIDAIIGNIHLFLDAQAPQKVVNLSLQHNQSIEKELVDLGIADYLDSEFHEQCRLAYYIKQLETLDLDSDHKILHEVAEDRIKNARVSSNGPYLGHAALRILIGRNLHRDISTPWLNCILSIAGDPRTSKNSIDYQNWWAPLDHKLLEATLRWLSKVELKFFLQLLEDSGKYNEKIARMFPQRKAFIEGLLNRGLIASTRLMLGNAARYYFSSVDQELLSKISYAKVKTPETSFVYIRLRGNGQSSETLHLMEGTHNCCLRMQTHLPEYSRIDDFGEDKFSDAECRSGFLCCASPNHSYDSIEIVHSKDWQVKALNFIQQHGFNLSPADIGLNSLHYKETYGYRY